MHTHMHAYSHTLGAGVCPSRGSGSQQKQPGRAAGFKTNEAEEALTAAKHSEMRLYFVVRGSMSYRGSNNVLILYKFAE